MARHTTLELTCRCGACALALDMSGWGAASRVVCYCDDCQTAARALGAQTAVLGAGSGTQIVQTTPDRIALLRGADGLRIVRLSPKGLLRWYAGCCDTPMLNTLPNLKLPFVGVVIRPDRVADVAQVLGQRSAHVFTTTARPRADAPRKDVGFAAAGFAVLRRMLVAGLSGRGRLSPLRAQDAAPIAPVRVLTAEERHDARPG